MKCLLIGGAGFIGHNLAIGLIKEGHEVKIIDSFMVNNLTSVISNEDDLLYPEWSYHILKSRINSLKEYNIEIASTDARDYHLLSREVSDFKPDVIYHLAAVSHANRSNKTPHNTFDHSFRTLENALDVSKSLGCRFIYFSSSMIYGSFPGEEVTEESPLSPLGIYGTLKWCGEKLVHAYNKVFGLEYVIVRPSALYGERCISRRVGQVFIESALFGEEITIEGDGSSRLDFTYIDDLVQGLILCGIEKSAANNIFNLTYGNARPISDLLTILKEYYPNLKIKYLPKDKLVPERGKLSNLKAKNLLDFNPHYSLEDGYRRYVEWCIKEYKAFKK